MSTAVNSTQISIPTGTLEEHNRPLIPIQMKKPDGTWSNNIVFNFDTGASWATDVPPQLLEAFGGKVKSGDRKEQPGKIRIPGLDIPEMEIPIVVQDGEHYDLFREQSSRYPLLRVRDLMPYVSIVYEKTKTTIRSKSLGIPEELSEPGVITMPQGSERSGTPTNAYYWNKGTMTGTTGTTVDDWFNICTGDRRFIIKRSIAKKIKLELKRTDDRDEHDSVATISYNEGKPAPLVLNDISITVRDDDSRFARGGKPRNLCGGLNFLEKYKIIIWDLNLAFVPVQ
jgi:hypothetical protein